jgi:Kef-type K+ transport system membrane component KefB
MMPRGEVGLIFALTGQQLGVFDGETFAAVIMMVIITTVITPLALQMLVKRSKKIEG